MADDTKQVETEAGQTCREYINEFKSNTTLHGLPWIFGTRQVWRKRLWIFLVLSCATGLIVEISENSIKMFTFQIIQSTTPTFNKLLKFPAVTICNENLVKKSLVKNTATEQKLGYIVGTNRNVSEAILNSTCDLEEEFKRNGYNISDLLLTGAWNMRTAVTSKDFQPYFNLNYGQCYTFNGWRRGSPARTIGKKGARSGLEVLLDAHPEEYSSFTLVPASDSVGFRVVIHDQRQEPLVGESGISVSPGYKVDFSLKMKQIKRKPSPYPSNCVSGNTKKLPLSSKPYSVTRCEEECMVKLIIQECKCKVSQYKEVLLGVPICRVRDYRCVTGTHNETFDCDCPLPCEEDWYEVTTSTSYHPSPSFLSAAQRLYYNHINFTSEREFSEFYRKRAVYIRVYFETLYSDMVEEKASYDSTSFLADLGGHLGLFLGCSILTLCEFIDLIALSAAALFKKHFDKSKVKTLQIQDGSNW